MLDPNKLKIDDRSIQQLLKDLLITYGQIPFIENGVEVGKWDELFKGQLLFFWVEIHESDLTWWQKERDLILKNWDIIDSDNSGKYLIKVLSTFYKWFVKAESYLQLWVIKELESCLASLDFKSLDVLIEETKNDKDFTFIINEIKKRKRERAVSSFIQREGTTKVKFEETTNLILNCLFQIKNELMKKDWDELVSTELHPPHIGLAYGFLKAYEKVKEKINEVPKRHLDYYYKDILQQEKAKARPDENYVFFQLNKEVKSFVLPKGTVLLGEADESGKEKEYATVSDSYLTNTRISELKTLLINASDDIAPSNKINAITGIYQNEVNSELLGNYSNEKEGWCFFGEPKIEQIASVGWALASPSFLTFGGDRSYELIIELSDDSAEECRKLLEKLAEKDRHSQEELFFSYLNQAFDIQITGLTKWMSINKYQINFYDFLKKTSNAIKLNFSLLAIDEAWVPFSKEVHGDTYTSPYPLIEFKIKENTVYYPYSFLKCMRWKSLGVNIEVNNSTKLTLYNKHGLIDSASPFPLFGVTPLRKDEFSIGTSEWIYKNLSQIDVQIVWLQPPSPNLEDYYKDYKTVELKDQDFKIAVLQSKDQKEYNLFDLDSDGELKDTTLIEGVTIFKKSNSKLIPDESILKPNETPLAFVNFELSSPDVGFGSKVYNEELILFSQEKARDRKNKLNLFPPNVPFIPYVKKINVNYKSSNTVVKKAIDGGNTSELFDFFHIHPHGILKVANNESVADNNLVPNFEDRAYLYLGIEGLITGTALCLYVKLEQSNIIQKVDTDFQLEYLTGKHWSILSSDNILENTVERGLNSGMITFRVPHDIDNENPFYSKEKNWIRISVKNKHANKIGKCLMIKPNCSLIERINIGHEESIKLAEPETVVKFKSKPKQITQVSQPMSSFGGRGGENEAQMFERTAQLLGHKNRMVRPRDFKRMLFEEFDELAWIKVATPTMFPESVKAGEVHIIVLPNFTSLGELEQQNIHYERIEAIENYIKRHSYPGIKIKVFSPQIEIVEVCVDIILNRLAETPPLEELTDLINRTISPWAFSKGNIENVDMSFNTINVLNGLNKIKSIWKVEVCEAVQIIKSGTNFSYVDSAETSEQLVPSTYKSILIPSIKHKIRFITVAQDGIKDTTIGNMVIGTDLIIREQGELPLSLKEKHERKKSLFVISTNEINP